jgi:hypothetical protein
MWSFRKRNVIIREEIPDRYHPDGKQLGEIKILLQPAMDQPHDQVRDSQPYKAYDEEFGVLPRNVRVLAFKSPYTVQEIIGRCRHDETYGIGNIFLDLQPLLADVRKPKIYKNSGKTDNPEFQELDQEGS